MTQKLKYGKLKRLILCSLLIIMVLGVYVEIANRNTKNMTYRQKVLKAFYPVLIWFTNLSGKKRLILSNVNTSPVISFYSLKDTLISGAPFDFSLLKGKKVLLVNTASDCGYTNQYADLENLYQQYKNKLMIIGFPANNFKEQEKGTDSAIADFCKINYGVTFLLMKKSSVLKGPLQNTVFQWLTHASANGWNEQQPFWNFCKYIVDENGKLIYFMGTGIEPLSNVIVNIVKE